MLFRQAKQKLIPFPEMRLKFNPRPCALAVEVAFQKASTSIKAYQTFSKKSTAVFCPLPVLLPNLQEEVPVDTGKTHAGLAVACGMGRQSERSEEGDG
jgi:hypothetical protein